MVCLILSHHILRTMSLRNFFKHCLPHKDRIRKQGGVKLFSNYLHDPNIWHLHRRSSATGAAIGMFCAFIPLPIHTISAVLLAILLRANLPIAVVFSLFSNPITMPPLFIFAYQIGTKLLALPQVTIHFSFSWDWIMTTFAHIWKPLLLGCFMLGTISALLTYVMIRLIWRLSAISQWENRRRK